MPVLTYASMKAILHIEGGSMDGQRFEGDFSRWPPPDRLIGQDIHRNLFGTYERISYAPGHAGEVTSIAALYRLREDDDLHRMRQGWYKANMQKQISRLVGGFRT